MIGIRTAVLECLFIVVGAPGPDQTVLRRSPESSLLASAAHGPLTTTWLPCRVPAPPCGSLAALKACRGARDPHEKQVRQSDGAIAAVDALVNASHRRPLAPCQQAPAARQAPARKSGMLSSIAAQFLAAAPAKNKKSCFPTCSARGGGIRIGHGGGSGGVCGSIPCVLFWRGIDDSLFVRLLQA